MYLRTVRGGDLNVQLQQQLVGHAFLAPAGIFESHASNDAQQFHRNARSALQPP